MQPFQIFLSSPGDVAAERERAELVVRRINAERPDSRPIKLIRWEEDYYLSTRGTFQDQIVRPSECDLVVCIFWRRLGSNLPEKYARADGTTPTGTEFEFEDALGAAERSDPRLPGVMVFKKEAATFQATLDSLEMERIQYERFQAFWSRWFRNEKGHFLAAFNAFSDTDAFEQMFERNLRAWLDDQESHVEWRQGSPYRGLEAFDVEHAPIFFGRRRETERARARLIQAAMGGTAFLLITGASGAGKSSLARAGLLAMLAQPGGLGSLAIAMRHATVTPGEIARDWALGLATALFGNRAIASELEQGDFADPEALAAQLRRGDLSAAGPVLSALKRAGATLARQQSRSDNATVTLVLLVDQLEEIFGWPKADAETFFGLLAHLATAKGHPVWVVATMRSDFQHRLAEFPALDRLAGRSEVRGPGEGERTLELVLPRASDLKSIITRPARAAGVGFEVSNDRDLAQIIEADARPELMPAVQLLLNELYQRRSDKTMTLAAHDSLGGVAGVMARRGDEVLEKASPEALAAFARIARALVTQVRDDAPASARRVPETAFADDPGAAELTTALRNSRLIVSHQGELRFAHESILTGWQRLKDIIAGEHRLYEARQRIEEIYRRWKAPETGAQRDTLLLSGLNLAEGRELLNQWGDQTLRDREAGLPDFIRASDTTEKRAGRRKMLALGAIAAALAIFAGFATKFWFDADKARDQAMVAEGIARDQATRAAQARDETAAQLKKTTVALKLVESAGDLADGNIESAAARAAEAFALQPGFETRSALLKAGLEISPNLEARIRHPQNVRALTFAGNDKIALADDERRIAVYDIARGVAVKSWDLKKSGLKLDSDESSIVDMAAMDDGSIIALAANGMMILADSDGTVWARQGEPSLDVQQAAIADVNGNRIALAMIIDNEAVMRDCRLDRQSRAMECADERRGTGNWFLARRNQQSATLSIGDGLAARMATADGQSRDVKFDGSFVAAHFNQAGNILAAADLERKKITFLAVDPAGLPIRQTINPDEKQSSPLTSLRMAWRSTDNTIAHACDGNFVCVAAVSLTDTSLSIKNSHRLGSSKELVTKIAWSPDGNKIVSRDAKNQIWIWSLAAPDRAFVASTLPTENANVFALSRQPPISAFQEAETGALLVDRAGALTRIEDDRRFRALTFAGGRLVGLAVFGLAFPVSDAEVGLPAWLRTPVLPSDPKCDLGSSVALVSAGGTSFAFICNDGRIAIGDALGKTETRFLAPADTDEAPFGLAFDARRNHLISSHRDGSLHVFDVASGKHLGRLNNRHADDLVGAGSLRATPDGGLLALSGSGPYVLLFDLESRSSIARLAMPGTTETAAVAFSPMGTMLAALNAQNRVMLWTIAGQKAEPWAEFRLPGTQAAAPAGSSAADQLDWLDDSHPFAAGGHAPSIPVALDEKRWLDRLEKLGYRLDKPAK